MNASQNNFRKSRQYTYVALALGLLSVGALSVALLQVDSLEREYGSVRSDIQRYNTERTDALARRDAVLSEISQRSVEGDGIRKTVADLMEQRDRLKAEINQQTTSLSDGAEKLRATQDQTKLAAETIEHAAAAEKALSNTRSLNADLDKRVIANQAKIDQYNTELEQAESRKTVADEAAAASEKIRRDKETEIAKLNQQLQELDEKQRQFVDLTARQATLTSQIAKLTKDISEKQRVSQDLDATIAKQQELASKSKISAAKIDADMARQESNRSDIASQVNVLETKKASLTGDLNSIAASADNARSEAAAAEGRLKVAQEALAEAEKALPGVKAQLGDVQSDIAVATNQLDSIKLEVTNLQALRAKYSIDKSDVDRATAEKETLETAVTDLQGRQAQLAKELELKQGELTAIRDELANLNGRKGVLAQQIVALDEEKTSKDVVQPPPPPEAAPTVVQPATP